MRHNGSSNGAEFNPRSLPADLRRLDRWIDWHPIERLGKLRKRPRLSLADPDFPQRLKDAHPPKPGGGYGLCLTGGVQREDGATLFALDCDACVDPKTAKLAPWLRELIDEAPPTYWEVTPSGFGVRAYFWVHDAPSTARKMYPAKHRDDVEQPPGCTKTPEIQLFGLPVANFVTVTSEPLDDPKSVPHVAELDSLDELILDRYDGHGLPSDAADMPTGVGTPPSTRAILAEIEKHPDGPALLAGDYETLGVPSASEAWFQLARLALRAANGHGEAAAQALLDTEVWGGGQVDSAEPARYASESWVRTDLARVAAKAADVSVQDAIAAFEEIDPDTIELPSERPQGLLTQVAEFGDPDDEDFFLIYNVLPAVGLAQFYGDPGCGKTPFVMSAALHIAAGRASWFGREIDRTGAVVYMAGEGIRGVQRRFRADAEKLGVELDAVPLYVTKRPGQLIDRADAKVWVREARRVCPEGVRVLVIDTQAQNFGPGDENSTEDMNRFVQNAQAIARALDTCVVIVHHTGHMHKQRARGSSVMFGALDACFEVTRAGARVTATTTKSKDWEAPAPLVGTLDVVELGQDRHGRPRTAVRLDPVDPGVSEAFQTADEKAETLDTRALLEAVEALKGQVVVQEEIVAAAGFGRTKGKNVLRRCRIDGLIETVEHANSKTSYRLTQAGEMWLLLA